MTSNIDWAEIARHITLCEGKDQVIRHATTVAGGDIAQAYRVHCGADDYFVKTQKPQYLAMFQAEAAALAQLREFAPRAICSGIAGDAAYLAMEYCELSHSGNEESLGDTIANLHRTTNTEGRFGWEEDNFIGLTAQRNTWSDSWADFFWRHRLAPQLQFAYAKGFKKPLAKFENALAEAAKGLLRSHRPSAALLHGDLWSGNKAFLPDGRAIIFDPAAYYGDPETDIAMTELFGGFGPRFYDSYYRHHPRQSGYDKRKALYNLYHLLNHLSLFGSGYLGQCERYILSIIEE